MPGRGGRPGQSQTSCMESAPAHKLLGTEIWHSARLSTVGRHIDFVRSHASGPGPKYGLRRLSVMFCDLPSVRFGPARPLLAMTSSCNVPQHQAAQVSSVLQHSLL